MVVKPLVLCGWVNCYTGYGQHCLEIMKYFRERTKVHVRPIELWEQFASVPSWAWDHCLFEAHQFPWELALYHSYYQPNPEKRTAWFTMWESTKLHDKGKNRMNGCPVVIVPCRWNEECFRASGVKAPIERVPLGIDPKVFSATAMNMDGPTVFGAAGRLKHGKSRKGVNHVVELFQKAFPTEKDVFLLIKSFPDETELTVPNDPRIEVIWSYYTDADMARYYQRLTCFVSAARGEGWGLMQHQAMACGRPVIAAPYGGLAEFMTDLNSYSCRYRLVDADEQYTGLGKWAKPDDDHMIELMRDVHKRRMQASLVGAFAARDASELTWDNSNQKLEAVLTKYGVL